MDFGLLLLRVVLGLLIAGHGAQKLFGWFDGPGPERTAGMMGSLGFHPARSFALLGGLVELGGGALLALGWFTPIAAGFVAAQMVNAITSVHWPKGLWNTNGGYEYPLFIAVAALALAATGPGRYSVDHLTYWWAPAVGFAVALVLTVLGAFVGEAARHGALITGRDRMHTHAPSSG